MNVFIIGNGFDLDLGFKLSYKDFVNSQYWPFDKINSNNEKYELDIYADEPQVISFSDFLCGYLPSCWYDLEGLIQSFVINTKFYDFNLEFSKEAYFRLCSKLHEYISNEFESRIKSINKDCCAAKVLGAIINNKGFKIYNFNYTDLRRIASQLSIRDDFSYEHVHGSVKDNTIILGSKEISKVAYDYLFMVKSFNRNYESHSIRYDLQKADEIVFFGHSLGEVDYVYFQEFFQKQSSPTSFKDSKKITIITLNDESRMKILSQLREMNDFQTEKLINSNKFQFIMTDSADFNEKKFDEFIKHLKDTEIKEWVVMS